MIRKYNTNGNKIARLAALIILATIVLLAKNGSGAQPIAPADTGLIKSSSATFSGNAYSSDDPSAISNSKATFGNANAVSFANLKSETTPVKISTGSLSKSTPINPLDFGTNEIWYNNGNGTQDPQSNQVYNSVGSLTKKIGVSVIRYPGGIPSDTFHWEDAIGPQSQRSSNVVYQAQKVFFPSAFGPDEFGQLLDKTGAVGDITVNFGTGTAQEAADWVQYMTASSQGNEWGTLRAINGHPAPYKIPYWEVGNEQGTQEYYWRSGSVVSINDGNQCASSNIHLCEYVYGGVTAFTKQKTISPTNKSSSNGGASQVFYAEYPPIVKKSQVVYVNNRQWQPVPSIAGASRGELAYQIDNPTGKIIFGNGMHGAILPAGATVTISYQSGPHDGFIQYYRLMKAADPNAQICSSFDSTDFIKLMGFQLPYDCLTVHLYGEQVTPTGNATIFHDVLMKQSDDLAAALGTQQADIKKYAGSQAKKITLAVTEYGVNALTSPTGQPNYHRSQDLALFDANLLRGIIVNNIPIAEKHFLISYEYSSPLGIKTFINSSTFANNALIGGPGSNPIPQPSAYVLEAYSKLLYSNLISSTVDNNPSTVYSGGDFASLSVLATTNKKGQEAIMVINLSPTKSILAEITPSLTSYRHATAWTLGANNVLAYNTPSDPTAVGFVKKTASFFTGKISANFPPGSITVLQLSK